MKTVFKTLTAAAALASALASTATAQDAELWEGFYAGARVNMQDLDISGAPVSIDTGFNIGIYGGYNHAVAPNFVLGGELSYDSQSEHTIGAPPPLQLDNNFSLRARGGYAFGNTLLYGTAGYSWSDFNVPGVLSGSAEGFVYGVGLEHMITESVSTRFEYTRSDLDLSAGGLGVNSADVNRFSIGVSYKF